MTYLAGNPLIESDLDRAITHKAQACILLTNKNSANSSREDYRNILVALAIKKHVYDKSENKDANASSVRICL
jgi:hypothetical protein